MFAGIVRVLDRPHDLVPELIGLGQRHVGYGVQDDDYASIGTALLWLLEQVLPLKRRRRGGPLPRRAFARQPVVAISAARSCPR